MSKQTRQYHDVYDVTLIFGSGMMLNLSLNNILDFLVYVRLNTNTYTYHLKRRAR